MRELLYFIIICIAVVIITKIYRKTRGDLFSLFWAGLILLIIIVGIFNFINVNTTPEDVESVVGDIVNIVGDIDIIRVNSNDEIELCINEEWVSVSEISVLSWATDDIVVEYDGMEIKIMDSGLTSAIKILDKLGFLD